VFQPAKLQSSVLIEILTEFAKGESFSLLKYLQGAL
jgi:hypothetical protein